MASEKVAEEAAQPPKRKKFTIPLEEAPPLEVKSLFKSSRSLPSPITSVHEAPLNYADYTTSRLCPGRIRAEATLQGARPKAAQPVAQPKGAPQGAWPEAAQPGAQLKGAAQGAWPEAAQPGTQPKGASQGARPEVDQPGAQPKAAPQGAGSEAAPSLGQPGGEIANQGPQGSKPQTKSSSITVSPRQRGNPVLKFIRNVPWEFGEIVPDYVMGQSTCALFLSLRYHNLHPNYIHERLQGLGKNYALRVLLLQIDVKDPQRALKDLAKMCILADCTLILAWSPEEAGRYLETYKSYEQKPADLLKEKLEQDFVSRVTECLTTVKSVNKTDSQTLLATFGSLEQLTAASQDDLSLCPGFGPQKARRLFEVLHQPFLKVP